MSESTVQEPVSLFDQHFPPAFMRKLVAAVQEAYTWAREHVALYFGAEEAHDVYPIVRRARLEENLRSLVADFPGVEASTHPNANGVAFHVQLRSGPIILTASAVADRNYVVRHAVFRTTLARTNLPTLFPDYLSEPAVPSRDAALYAILIHGATSEDPEAPYFVDVVFPLVDTNDQLVYHENRIDLLARAHRSPMVQVEVVADTAEPMLASEVARAEVIQDAASPELMDRSENLGSA